MNVVWRVYTRILECQKGVVFFLGGGGVSMWRKFATTEFGKLIGGSVAYYSKVWREFFECEGGRVDFMHIFGGPMLLML